MQTEFTRNNLKSVKKIVVKTGSSLITGAAVNSSKGGSVSRIDTAFINRIAGQVAALHKKNIEVTLVTSGSIALGCDELNIKRRPADVARLQALSAIGQRKLLVYLHRAFKRRGLHTGQVLLSRSDFDNRTRFLNIRNCINELHKINCIPIINENDPTAVDEIRFGDNDILAAGVCSCLGCDGAILLTSVDGLLDENGSVIETVNDIGKFKSLARGKSEWGSGGMASKLEAARKVTEAGDVAVIAPGAARNVLVRILNGENVGTLLPPTSGKLTSKKKWIGLTARHSGTITIDKGAEKAILERGKSLLASGVIKMSGQFGRGDILLIKNANGKEIARGLTNYPNNELKKIMGKRSDQFEKILGKSGYDEIIHRDNLHIVN